MRWLISVPVWGEEYVGTFLACGLPSIQRAANALCATGVDPDDVVLVAHSDNPGAIRDAAGMRVEARGVPAGLREFDCLSQAHREVFKMGMTNDIVLPLNGDNVLSEEALVTIAKRLVGPARKSRAVACSGFRAIRGGLIPSTKSRDLHRWAWENRHPITRECTWPDGKLRDLSRVCFEDGENVSARLVLPHPVAVRIDGRPLSFTPTVDANLLLNFAVEEIYLVTSPDELALVELSPLDKTDTHSEATMRQRLESRELRLPQPMQRALVQKRITLCGEMGADCGDAAYVEKLLAS